MERNCGIYIIENIIDGKVYIGSSVAIATRWDQHRCDLRAQRHANHLLQAAYNTHGIDALTFRILEECDPDNLIVREQCWIDFYDSIRSGYNLIPAGGGGEWTDERASRMGLVMTAKWNDPEYRRKQQQTRNDPALRAIWNQRIKEARARYEASKYEE